MTTELLPCPTETEIEALRWLLNISLDKPRSEIGTFLDRHFDASGKQSTRTSLEILYAHLKRRPALSADAPQMERLGPEFEKVLHDNLESLYERDAPVVAPSADAVETVTILLAQLTIDRCNDKISKEEWQTRSNALLEAFRQQIWAEAIDAAKETFRKRLLHFSCTFSKHAQEAIDAISFKKLVIFLPVFFIYRIAEFIST